MTHRSQILRYNLSDICDINTIYLRTRPEKGCEEDQKIFGIFSSDDFTKRKNKFQKNEGISICSVAKTPNAQISYYNALISDLLCFQFQLRTYSLLKAVVMVQVVEYLSHPD